MKVLDAILKPLKSRKVQTAIVALIVAYLAEMGLDASPELVYAIVAVAVARIIGVAIEDHGEKSNSNNGRSIPIER